jgi:predicted outer membrane repeat protein
MKRCGLCLVVCLFLLVSVCSTTSARTWYIKVDGTGDAPTIQAGCDLAQHGDTVLVGPGTYTISAQGSNQYGMISILRGSADMTIVGEAGAGATILDGQFQNRIFFFQGETELTVDGFTFTAGEAPLTGSFTGGAFAAHFSSPVMKNCVFINNSANDGGAYWYGGFGTPLILDCVFIGNSGVNGGAMYLINSPGNVVVSNCLFEDNTASNDGGAIWTYNFRVSIEGCVFDHNSAAVDGGAVAVNNSYPIPIMSTTFYQNSAANGGAVAVTGASPVTIDQSIIASGLGGAATYVDATSTLTCGCTDIWGKATATFRPTLGFARPEAPTICCSRGHRALKAIIRMVPAAGPLARSQWGVGPWTSEYERGVRSNRFTPTSTAYHPVPTAALNKL